MKSTALSTDLPLQMMQGLAAATLCQAGPVLQALRPGGMAPQANPTTPPRRPREPSPSTPGDNKRQSRRLKAGQQALAGLTLGSLPVSASDTPAAGTSTQRTGEVEESGGETGPAYHPTDHSRPQYLRQDHVPPDGFQAGFLERRWRKALVGTVGPVGPTAVQSSSAGSQDPPPPQFPRDLEQGVPLGVTDPPLTSPGMWPLMEEVPMGMVEGPFSKEEAASRCGCASADLCPGPLAGIDEGDKIRNLRWLSGRGQ